MEKQVQDDEVELLVNDLLELYGYDFTEYARASLQRRVNRLYLLDKFVSFAEFRYKIRNDKDYLHRFVSEITVNVTEMFRDPSFYKSLVTNVFPILATYPLIRIWLAGCATGQEAYSVAILLKEANLLHKSLIYATDINPEVLDVARKGIYPLNYLKEYSENYILAGGKNDFSNYYAAKYQNVLFDESLSTRMVFATHNLATDTSFNEFQLIVCRNVLIYFNAELQETALNLFDSSLQKLGYLALGSKESIRFFSIAESFKQLDNREKIWRKIK